MWNDENDEMDNVLLKIGNIKFPYLCPVCGKNSCHLYMTRFDGNDNHGSAWIWCSDCHNYSHFQYKIPNWWKNCSSINIDMLESEPDYLENKKDEIDQWVNVQMQKKV